MALDSPLRCVGFFPLERLPPKIDFHFGAARHADSSIHIRPGLIAARRQVCSNKGIWQSPPIPREEDIPSCEFIPKSKGVAVLEILEVGLSACIVPPAVRIFEEFAHVIKVQAGAEAVPAGEAPLWIWPGS